MTERTIDKGAVAAGILLIAIGAVMLAGRFGGLEFSDVVRHYWPMILVLIGIPKVMSYKTLWNGLWLIVLGIWMQLATLHIFGVTWSNSWPLLLIVYGVGTITRTLVDVLVHDEVDHEN
jgi:hypothetical protein